MTRRRLLLGLTLGVVGFLILWAVLIVAGFVSSRWLA